MCDIEGSTAFGDFSTLNACFRAAHGRRLCFHTPHLAPLWSKRCGSEHLLQAQVAFDRP